ncbi:triphosphoribosyl-dephospho-CoA synthase [Deferribacter autotrophicus]|uniref:triphosphoribosyl-dephospho-CoA synthase n=1 Tax=Deferribacter autotrophicus TaxID=500465 RepID=UPI001FEED4D8|nr:triphosphoribosyl-dephospho-CoA synthase [Deferribacter autotrophicus]
MFLKSSKTSYLKKVAYFLRIGALVELFLTPKPGLVDLIDSGSHRDLDFDKMYRSILIMKDYHDELITGLCDGFSFADLQQIGIKAETRMYDMFGTNTHKGYIFLSGLLLCSLYLSDDSQDNIRLKIIELSKEHFSDDKKFTNTFGGIANECLKGLPSVFEEGLPALSFYYSFSKDIKTSLFYLLARLMQTVEDTTAIRRCGIEGLKRLKRDGFEIERSILLGENYKNLLISINREYQKLNLTMGGVADILGICVGFFYAKKTGITLLF